MLRGPRIRHILKTLCLAALAGVAFAQPRGVLQTFSLGEETVSQWRLPGKLNEISGLALTPDGRLLAVDDEIAIVYEVDYVNGGLVKAFAFGNPAAKGDFEGIAVIGGRVFLADSDGRIYLAAEGADGQRVTFDTVETGVGEFCEIEGLAQSPDGSRLHLLCKQTRKNAAIDGLTVFAWSVEDRRLVRKEFVLLPDLDIRRELRVDRFNPSGITIDAATGNFVIVAARQRALAEISPDGRLVEAKKFVLSARHRQAEGIELNRGGKLLIADEGGAHKARLAVYAPDEKNDE